MTVIAVMLAMAASFVAGMMVARKRPDHAETIQKAIQSARKFVLDDDPQRDMLEWEAMRGLATTRPGQAFLAGLARNNLPRQNRSTDELVWRNSRLALAGEITICGLKAQGETGERKPEQ